MDSISVNGLDPAFNANLAINGDTDDAVSFDGATQIGAGSLVATARTITVNAPFATAQQGSIRLDAIGGAGATVDILDDLSTISGTITIRSDDDIRESVAVEVAS